MKYDISYYEDKVVVTKDNREKVEISIGENGINTKNVLSKDLLEVLKQLPGSIYFKIDKYKLNKIGKEIDNVSEKNAHYSHNENIVSLSNELAGKDGIATLLHELGHLVTTYAVGEKLSILKILPFGFSCKLKNQIRILPKKMLKI